MRGLVAEQVGRDLLGPPRPPAPGPDRPRRRSRRPARRPRAASPSPDASRLDLADDPPVGLDRELDPPLVPRRRTPRSSRGSARARAAPSGCRHRPAPPAPPAAPARTPRRGTPEASPAPQRRRVMSVSPTGAARTLRSGSDLAAPSPGHRDRAPVIELPAEPLHFAVQLVHLRPHLHDPLHARQVHPLLGERLDRLAAARCRPRSTAACSPTFAADAPVPCARRSAASADARRPARRPR